MDKILIIRRICSRFIIVFNIRESTLCPEAAQNSLGNLLDCFANARNDDIDSVIASHEE